MVVLAFYLRALWSISGTLGRKRMSFLRETAEVSYSSLGIDFLIDFNFEPLSSTLMLDVFLIFIESYKSTIDRSPST